MFQCKYLTPHRGFRFLSRSMAPKSVRFAKYSNEDSFEKAKKKMVQPSVLERAHQCGLCILRTTCFLKLVPYNWNNARHRLEKASRWGRFVFHCTACIPAWCTVFMTGRYLQTMNQEAPPRIRAMNFNWAMGFALVVLCKMQVMLRTNQIMTFANALLERQERVLAKEKENESEKGPRKVDLVSGIIFLSTYLWVTNPPSHAIVLLDVPCAPQFISSILLPCRSIDDRPVPIVELLPFFIWEYYTILDMMTIVAFHWLIIFLGLTWVKESIPHDGSQLAAAAISKLDHLGAVMEFRLAQLLTRTINDGFHLYLTFFPSMLFLTSGVLIFSSIRFTHLPLHLYLVFPFCAFRCLLEVISQLEAAATVNLASELYLEEFGTNMRTLMTVKPAAGACAGSSGSRMQPSAESLAFAKYLRRFRRSCRKLTCKAGYLYTLEKTIVLVSMHGCTQLVFNLLLAIPRANEGNWGKGHEVKAMMAMSTQL